MTRKEVRDKLADYIRNHPQESYKTISLKLGCALSTINNISREYHIVRQRAALSEADLRKLEG
jgi:DNA invertase Pin-like site-specific DNA recombinase